MFLNMTYDQAVASAAVAIDEIEGLNAFNVSALLAQIYDLRKEAVLSDLIACRE